jgi:hypothetical protein
MEGFVSGNVWTAGFPQEEFTGSSGSSGSNGSRSGDFVDVDGGPVNDDNR